MNSTEKLPGSHQQISMKIKEELRDKQGIAQTLSQLGRIHEEKDKDYQALEKYLIAFSIFRDLNSPYAEIAENDLPRMKEKMSEEAFNKAFEDIMRQHGT